MTNTEAMREKFEAFAVANGLPLKEETAGHWDTRLAWKTWQAASRSSEDKGVPEGWALVPVEPTPEMIASTADEARDWTDEEIYRAMLAAAPRATEAGTESADQRFSVVRAPGSRFVYVADSHGQHPAQRFSLFRGDGWTEANQYCAQLNRDHLAQSAPVDGGGPA